MSKDNSFIFTRYLYEKEEVEIHLLLSFLYKKQEDALFWAYELFYSGFEKDLVNYLFKIYYYFYASLNPGLESFLIKKSKELCDVSLVLEKSKIIAFIVENLLIRPFNMDVFFLYNIYHSFEISFHQSFPSLKLNEIWTKLFGSEKEMEKINIELWLFLLFKSIFQDSLFILGDLIDYLDLDINKEMFLLNYKKTIKYILDYKNVNEKIMLLSKILYLYGLKIKKKMGKNLYIYIKSEDLVRYETIQVDLDQKNQFPAYKILSVATNLNVEPDQCSNLFTLKRETEDIRNAYLNHWLFYASKSPLWYKRIQDCKGKVDEIKKQVFFEEDDLLEAFYDIYGYEPEEQKRNVQNKSLGEEKIGIKSKNWFTLYKEFGIKNCFIDLDEDYIEQLEPLDKSVF